jgi:predicted amidohydrolase YtcJ
VNSSTSSEVPSSAADLWRQPGATATGRVDPHLHLLATAAERLSVSLQGLAGREAVLARLRAAAAELPAGRPLRAVRFERHLLGPGEDLAAADLDAIDPRRPLVVHERSGHEVLRSAAAAGASEPSFAEAELRAAVAAVGHELAAAGVVAITDAGHANGLAELELFERLRASGAVRQRLAMMVDMDALDQFDEPGLRHGEARAGVTVGHVKLIAEEHSGRGLDAAVAEAHRRGRPVAIHVLEVETLAAALRALRASAPPAGLRDRLEHVALALPEQVAEIAAVGAAVVTQPLFLVERGEKYRAELSPTERAWLYPLASLVRAGVPVAASSDAPVAGFDPEAIAAAARERPGFPESEGERVDARTALALVCGGVNGGVG